MDTSKQVSLFLGPHFVMTFKEAPGDVFAPMRERLLEQEWPMRDMLNRLIKGEHDLIQEEYHIYFADGYDYIFQFIDTNASDRDVLWGMLSLYLSTVSDRMNYLMKVLTLMATIWIPITFIATDYGMNFKHMPEQEWRWGTAPCGPS